MIQNKLFRDCLAAIPAEQKAEFDLSFGIAERLSEILQEKGLTKKDFARLLHKRDSEISKWLTGRHNFTTQTIARIQTALFWKISFCSFLYKSFCFRHLPFSLKFEQRQLLISRQGSSPYLLIYYCVLIYIFINHPNEFQVICIIVVLQQIFQNILKHPHFWSILNSGKQVCKSCVLVGSNSFS